MPTEFRFGTQAILIQGILCKCVPVTLCKDEPGTVHLSIHDLPARVVFIHQQILSLKKSDPPGIFCQHIPADGSPVNPHERDAIRKTADRNVRHRDIFEEIPNGGLGKDTCRVLVKDSRDQVRSPVKHHIAAGDVDAYGFSAFEDVSSQVVGTWFRNLNGTRNRSPPGFIGDTYTSDSCADRR